jgi:hypothetical protein
MRRGRKGDWQITNIGVGERPFQAFEMGENRAFRFRRSLASEAEVQAFVQERHLSLLETGTHGTWPSSLYRPQTRRRSSRRS